MVISVSLPSPSIFSDFQHLRIGGEDRQDVLGGSAASEGTATHTEDLCLQCDSGPLCPFSHVSELTSPLRLCCRSSEMEKVHVIFKWNTK